MTRSNDFILKFTASAEQFTSAMELLTAQLDRMNAAVRLRALRRSLGVKVIGSKTVQENGQQDLELTLQWWCPFCRDYQLEAIGEAAWAGLELEQAINEHLTFHVEQMATQ